MSLSSYQQGLPQLGITPYRDVHLSAKSTGDPGDGMNQREPLTSAPVTRDRTELVLASFLMLFTELVLIRWAGAYVIYLSYFANFILLGSFLGIGIGFLRAHRGPDLFRWAPVILAVFLGLVKALPVTIDRTGSDLVYFGV